MPILNYLLTMFGKKNPRVEIVRRESTSLRLEEWRAQPELVKLADQVWKNEDFRLMMQVIQNEHPGNYAVLEGGLETHAMYQSRTEGYNLVLAKLKSMRIPAEKIQDNVESEYAPEET